MRSGRSGSRATVVAAPSSGSEDSEWEEERVARLRERAWRDGPRGPGSGGKGRSRRSREQRTNWRVPAGHERKITAKIRATLAKRRNQQRPGRGPRSAPLQPRKRAEANAKVRRSQRWRIKQASSRSRSLPRSGSLSDGMSYSAYLPQAARLIE